MVSLLFIKSTVVSSQHPEPSLLPEIEAQDQGKLCVVIDLDETLVHSSFKVPKQRRDSLGQQIGSLSPCFSSKSITCARGTSSELHSVISGSVSVCRLLLSIRLLYNAMGMYTAGPCERACRPTSTLYVLPLQPISNADFIVPVEIEGTTHQVKCCRECVCRGVWGGVGVCWWMCVDVFAAVAEKGWVL